MVARMAVDFTFWLGAVTVPTVATGVAMGLLLAAAWNDLRERLIPDLICVVLAVLGCAFRLHAGLIDFAFSVTASLLLFFLLFAAFNRGVVGGGDVKLMVAAGLWLSPPDCYVFVVSTALAGGVLAVVHLLLRAVTRRAVRVGHDPGAGIPVAAVTPTAVRSGVAPHVPVVPIRMSVGALMQAELARIQSGCPLPYGVAIAAGGWYAMLLSLGG